MTEIREGGCYVAKSIRNGVSSVGPWEILIVQNKGPRQPALAISVIDPPSGITLSGAFRVDRIHSVMVRNWQDKNGNWHKGGAVTVRAEVMPTELLNQVKDSPQNADMNPPTDFPSLEGWFD